MTLVVLIADAGPEAGLGHLSRCSSLALALKRQGARVRTLGLGLEAPFERYGVSWEPSAEPDAGGAEAIVLDSYRAADQLRVALATAAPVAAFCDDERDPPGAALVIRSGEATGEGGEVAGPSHACLGPEFWSCPPRRPSPVVGRALVTTGGGDHTNAGPALASGLCGALEKTEVVLVRGPFAAPTDVPAGVHTASTPSSLFDLLLGADLVVSAVGQTALEALAIGTPCVGLVTAENQERQAAELRATGALLVASSVEEAVGTAATLAADLEMRNRQVLAGQAVVDGRGAMRTAAAVLSLARSTASPHPDANA